MVSWLVGWLVGWLVEEERAWDWCKANSETWRRERGWGEKIHGVKAREAVQRGERAKEGAVQIAAAGTREVRTRGVGVGVGRGADRYWSLVRLLRVVGRRPWSFPALKYKLMRLGRSPTASLRRPDVVKSKKRLKGTGSREVRLC